MRPSRRDDSVIAYKLKSCDIIYCRFCSYDIYDITDMTVCHDSMGDEVICCSHTFHTDRWITQWNFNNNTCEILVSFNSNINTCLMKSNRLCNKTCSECKLFLPTTKQIAMKNILNVEIK